jgi:hypothetical protein
MAKQILLPAERLVDSNIKIGQRDGTIIEKGVILNENYLEEKIYLGVVKDILPGMQAAFIDIGEEKNTFIHLELGRRTLITYHLFRMFRDGTHQLI